MTIGDKIRYCRVHCGITQAKLAELSGISLVSIKRYETNKMTPTQHHIEKLSGALGVGVIAFNDPLSEYFFKLETYGDIIKLIMIFRKNNIFLIDGERKDDGSLNAETIIFKLNPLIGKFFHLSYKRDTYADTFSFCLGDEYILNKFIQWERIYSKYEKNIDSTNSTNDNALIELKDILDKIELEMQYDKQYKFKLQGGIYYVL